MRNSDLMVVLDNSMYSINRDYNRERLECQIEAVKDLSEKRLGGNHDSTIGAMSIGRTSSTKIVSPTSDRNTICKYLHGIKRDAEVQCGNSIAISVMALKYRTNQDQSILLFLGSPLDDEALTSVIDAVNDALMSNISVGIVLFGEALEYYDLLRMSIEECTEFTCVQIHPKDSFIDGVYLALRESMEEMDPELELAIKRSLQETHHQQNTE